MSDNSNTLRDRLEQWPPFLVLALSKVRTAPLTAEDKKQRLWNRTARKVRARLKRKGVDIPRKPQYRRLTLMEVECRSGLSTAMVRHLSKSMTWDSVWMRNCLDFMEACGFDLMRIKRNNQLLRDQVRRKCVFSHLSKPEMAQVAKLVQKWKGN